MTTLHVTNGDIVVDHLRRAGWPPTRWPGPTSCTRGRSRPARRRRAAPGPGRVPRRRGRPRRQGGAAPVRGARPRPVRQPRRRLPALVRGRPVRPAPARPDPGRARRPRGGAGPGQLVCIGEYPGIAHFGGLGELEPGQLPGLLEAATPLTAEALDLGAAAWAALRAADPGGLGEVAASRSPQLRFLGEAFDRLGREYPSTRDGLSLTERRLLAATQQGGEPSAGAVFARLGEREARPFLADLFCFRILARLAGTRVPLVELDPPAGEVTAATRLRLTAAGARVLRERPTTWPSTASTAGSGASTSTARRRAGAGTRAPSRSPA